MSSQEDFHTVLKQTF